MERARAKPFVFGWEGDGGLGHGLIRAVLAGEKTATSGPASDPEDADVEAGDLLELRDMEGRPRGLLLATAVELRSFASFDDALAAAEGATLEELRSGTAFANGRAIPPDETMRVIRFRLLERA